MNPQAYVGAKWSPSLAPNASRGFFFFGQFCTDPCDDPFAQAAAQNLPPPRTSQPPSQSAVIFVEPATHAKRAPPSDAGEDLLQPPYAIDNAAGTLSDRTASVSP
jgi:hypothetical protein